MNALSKRVNHSHPKDVEDNSAYAEHNEESTEDCDGSRAFGHNEQANKAR
jgi:hypothetical protein